MAAASGPVRLQRCVTSPAGRHSASLIFLHGSGGLQFSVQVFLQPGNVLPSVSPVCPSGGGAGASPRPLRGRGHRALVTCPQLPPQCLPFPYGAVIGPPSSFLALVTLPSACPSIIFSALQPLRSPIRLPSV